jgi:hypothetical protein
MIDTEGASSLAAALGAMPHIVSLRLSSVDLGWEPNAAAVAAALQGMGQCLQHLELNCHGLRTLGIQSITGALSCLTSLTALTLLGVGATADGGGLNQREGVRCAASLAQGVRRMPHLHCLNLTLSVPRMPAEGVSSRARAAGGTADRDKLAVVSGANCVGLGACGVIALVYDGLRHACELGELRLRGHRMGDEGAEALAAMVLLRLPRLDVLDLGCCDLGWRGVSTLVGALRGGATGLSGLRGLCLRGNERQAWQRWQHGRAVRVPDGRPATTTRTGLAGLPCVGRAARAAAWSSGCPDGDAGEVCELCGRMIDREYRSRNTGGLRGS